MARLPSGSKLAETYVAAPADGRTYSFAFEVGGPEDVVLRVDGRVIPPSDYEVTLAPGGGSVRLLTAAETPTPFRVVDGAEVSLERSTVVERTTDLTTEVYARGEVVDTALDRLVRVIQEIVAGPAGVPTDAGSAFTGAEVQGTVLRLLRADGGAQAVPLPTPEALRGEPVSATEKALWDAAARYVNTRLMGLALAQSYEAVADRNRFSDANRAKLQGIESGAERNDPEIAGSRVKALYEGNADTNAFTDSDRAKLDGLPATAQSQSDVDARIALLAGTVAHSFRAALLSAGFTRSLQPQRQIIAAPGVSYSSGRVLVAGTMVGWQIADRDEVVFDASELLRLAESAQGAPLAEYVEVGLTRGGVAQSGALRVGRTRAGLPLLQLTESGTYRVTPATYTSAAVVPDSTIDARIAQWAREGDGTAVPLTKLPASIAHIQTLSDIINTIKARVADWAEEGNAALIPVGKIPPLPALSAVEWANVRSKPTFAPADAERNVQADWAVTDQSSDAYIKGKPDIPVQFPWADVTGKPDFAPHDAERNVQSDWNVSGQRRMTGSSATSPRSRLCLVSRRRVPTASCPRGTRASWTGSRRAPR